MSDDYILPDGDEYILADGDHYTLYGTEDDSGTDDNTQGGTMYLFGPGTLYGVGSAANATPRRFGGLQDCSVDFSFTIKELYGGSQFPLAIARGQGKIQCKAKQATLNGGQMNDIFFGQTMAASAFSTIASDEAQVIPSSTPWTVPATNVSTWVTDLGVTYAATGVALTKVAPGTPTTGQYCVTAGTYTFAAADAGLGVKLNYVYTTTLQKQINISNQVLGTTPLFLAAFSTVYPGTTKTATFILNRCTSSKLTFASKLDDFNIPEFDFSAFADDAGNIGTITLSD